MDHEIETILQTIKRNPIPSLKQVEADRKKKLYNFYEYYFDFPKNIENYKESLEILEDYQHVPINKVEVNDFIIYINKQYFYDLELEIGGYVMQNNEDYILVKNKSRPYKIKPGIVFKRITEEDKAKMKLMEIINEEKIDI